MSPCVARFKVERGLFRPSERCLTPLVPETSVQYPLGEKSGLALATDSRSPLARRIAIELLWLVPECRGLLAEAISRDISPTVLGLGTLPAVAGFDPGWANSSAKEQSVDRTWGPLASEVQRTWMSVET